MSDLPPEESSPQPAGSSETPPSVPQWAVPAVPPAPHIEPANPEAAPARQESSAASNPPTGAAPTPEPSSDTPAADIPAWANDPAVAQVPPHWAAPAVATDATAARVVPTVPATIPAVAATPAPGSSAANPPAGWYVPVPGAPGWTPSGGADAAQPASPAATPAPGWAAQTGSSPTAATASQTPVWPSLPGTAAAPPARRSPFNRARWLPTVVVAAIVAGVTLGGIGLDKVVAAPSAGTVPVGGSVTITAASGWVLVTAPGDTSDGIQLQKGNAVLTVQVVSTSFSGTSSSMVSEAEQSLGGSSAQISYGDVHHATISGNDTTYVTFEATMTSGQQSGIVDGELVCMVVESNETIIVAAAPQGHLQPVVDDVSAMLKSVRVGR
jgi:hypothetical protein